jgi:hypothetical protein
MKGLSEDMTFKFSLEGTAWQRILYTEQALNTQTITTPTLTLERTNVIGA